MYKCLQLEFWLIIISIIGISSMQENEDYAEGDSVLYEHFQIRNSEILRFNDSSYCLENVLVTLLPGSALGHDHLNLFYVKIMWSSKYLMSSLKVESDSLSDPYCEAQNKHYYCREPFSQKSHIFPDDVNEGVRFFPFKLDCKYIITPEFEGPCQPLQLNYSTPVCLNGETCSCRNVLIPGPVVKSELQQDGITVSWALPSNISSNVNKIVLMIYEEDGINVKKIARKVIPRRNFTSRKIVRNEQFQINVTRNNYRIQAYFENTLGCRGNTTFVRLRNGESLVVMSLQGKIIAFSVVLILVFVFLIWIFFRRKKLKKIYRKIFEKKESLDVQSLECISDNCEKKLFLLPPMEYNSAYLEQQGRDSYWFDYRDLIIERQIGSGNFGIVYFATSPKSINGFNKFAVKQIKNDSGPEGWADFLDEINIFKQVGRHPNIVKMFGYCSAPYPLSIIMEYVPFNLLKYLKNLRVKFESRKQQMTSPVKYAELNHSSSYNGSDDDDDDYISQSEIASVPINKYKAIFDERNGIYYVLDNRELETFALDIARGMAHLESKAIVHRDLAARNILMDESKNLKISDFGMSRTGIYVNKRTRNFPLRWMSPEALISRTFTNKSDVWSFGVVLWEIATLGAFPYASLQNEEVMSFLNKGGHLDQPENVTEELYKIMENCWRFQPEDRPSFADTLFKLEGICQKSNGYVDFENLQANYVFPPMEEKINKN